MSRTPCVTRFPKILFAESRHRVESILCQLRRQCLSVRRPWSMLQRRKQLLVKPGDHTLERKSIQCNIACHMSQNPPKMHPEAPWSATPLVTKEKAMRQMSESVPFLRGKKCFIGKKDGWYDPTLSQPSPTPEFTGALGSGMYNNCTHLVSVYTTPKLFYTGDPLRVLTFYRKLHLHSYIQSEEGEA